jgi:hypothetical protein
MNASPQKHRTASFWLSFFTLVTVACAPLSAEETSRPSRFQAEAAIVGILSQHQDDEMGVAVAVGFVLAPRHVVKVEYLHDFTSGLSVSFATTLLTYEYRLPLSPQWTAVFDLSAGSSLVKRDFILSLPPSRSDHGLAFGAGAGLARAFNDHVALSLGLKVLSIEKTDVARSDSQAVPYLGLSCRF